jgi:hypothetical protein
MGLLMEMPVFFSGCDAITGQMIWAGAGFVFFGALFFVFGPPVRSYLLEHELSHLLVALLSGVRVKRIALGRDGGYVQTAEVNLPIALAPYTVPLYTLFLIAVYKILVLFFSSVFLEYGFYFLFGLTISFHILATAHYVAIYQPDLARYGYFSSLVLIFICSLVILFFVLALMFRNTSPIEYFRSSIERGLRIYEGIGSGFDLIGRSP